MAKSNKAESANREIRVLSIQQPAADSIFWFGKWCENRDWNKKYRGEPPRTRWVSLLTTATFRGTGNLLTV